jgi:formylglycine-generating enzyme required for sulfatase activity
VRVREDLKDDDYWVMRREVTAAEYLEFLNDHEILRELADSPRPRLFPRQGSGSSAQPMWICAVDGTWELPPSWREDFPVVGISYEDALTYAAWLEDRRDDGFEYSLPKYLEYQNSGLGSLRRMYTWGPEFRAKFSRSCFARPRPGIGPVLQFPIDESPYGAFDFCGGAMEWLDHWYDEGRAMRHAGGGSWGQAGQGVLGVAGGHGVRDGSTTGETGLRLIARRARDGRR